MFGRERAENDIKEYAIKTQTLLADTVEEVAEWEIWKEVESSESVEELVEQWIKEIKTDTEVLGNEEPLFQNIPYLRLWLEERPLETLYLKGFLAGRYEDGVWSCATKEFEQACKKAGYDPPEVSKQLAFLGV